ncbi:nucleotide exchange factor GrpE [Sphingobacterium olei]|uniref:Protein GrpE n=2 Tax=Sphingobacterium olei TaxID=2571155 RepID=A0A4V5MMI4_9SPHI|nr:nucleotide exchange factor GrpE [Sphingobacterium olei]
MMNEQQENTHEENLAQEDTPQTEQETVSKEERLTQELSESNDRYARLFAEFDNYKKRTSKERIDLIQSAGQGVITKLLPIIDDFDRALHAMSTAQDIDSVKQGIELVNSKFRKLLENEGLKEMEVLGHPFDAEYQEAITAIPAPDEDQKNKVLDVVEKGYFLNDKVIRFAKVVIGQ